MTSYLKLALLFSCLAFCYGGFINFEDANVKTCLAENNITKHDAESNFCKSEQSQDFLCALECIGKKSGSIKPDGTMDVELIEKPRHMSDEKFNEAKLCLKEMKVESCDDIRKTLKCWLKHIIHFSEADKACISENELTEEDYMSNIHRPEPSQKYLCARKCIYEKDGKIETDGTIKLDAWKKPERMPQDKYDRFTECLSLNITKIEICDDIKKILECIDIHYHNHHGNHGHHGPCGGHHHQHGPGGDPHGSGEDQHGSRENDDGNGESAADSAEPDESQKEGGE